ncbi:MAG: HAMP domain-containing histidine kinase [Gammaproteobacteria bacterium]|nr:HAMP domain-containing histidine kinase [Gammaproteobacteria bacterium]
MTIFRLKILLLVFFIALALPSSILVYQAYGQLKWEAFHQHQLLARELSLRIDTGFQEIIEREETRPFTDYEFLNVTGNEQSAFLQRSPLSQYPLDSGIPGLLGHFQVDATGGLQTPLVPRSKASDYGIDVDELAQREDQENRLRGILSQNSLATELTETVAVVEEEADQQGLSLFDSLSSRSGVSSEVAKAEKSVGRVADLKLDDRYDVATQLKESKKNQKRKISRLETTLLPESVAVEQAAVSADVSSLLSKQQTTRIRTFESEVDPLEFSLLDSGHFVLFRRVWQDGERYVQGLLFDQNEFIDSLIRDAFQQSTLVSVSDLALTYQGNVVRLFGASYAKTYSSAPVVGSELLYQTRLVAPFSDLELIFSLANLPIGAGGQIILWSAFVLGLVLIGGMLMLYRLGAGQINLSRQQQDFVSAVSHELKTPLTSIRMYGEMLREGWADEARKKCYYDYIFNESERLSRLINNVLQLARLSRREQKANLETISIGVLLTDLSPRIESQLVQAGFEVSINCDEATKPQTLKVDSDWFTQIMINLVDNAIKFSANAEQKQVDINCRLQQGRIVFSVRDYGSGIDKDQIKKIFNLFYRSENELTRETVGTGIGLSLVQQLVSAMHGEVDVVNCEPGAEFRIGFVRE